MTKMTLEKFRVEPDQRLGEGKDLRQAKIPPVESMSILKFIADDEATQHKAMNFMFDCRVGLQLRGYNDSETSHPAWNAFRKAVAHSGFTISMMKLTLCCTLVLAQFVVCFLLSCLYRPPSNRIMLKTDAILLQKT